VFAVTVLAVPSAAVRAVPRPRTAIVEELANCRPGRRAAYEVDPEFEVTLAE